MQLILYSPGIWVIHRIFYPRSTLSDTPQGSGSLGLLLPLRPLVLASEIGDIVALPGYKARLACRGSYQPFMLADSQHKAVQQELFTPKHTFSPTEKMD